MCCFKKMYVLYVVLILKEKQNKKAPEDPNDVFLEVLKNVKTFLAVILCLSNRNDHTAATKFYSCEEPYISYLKADYKLKICLCD